ncbi:MAG: SocA family protein [Alphaproteobacteria bacterium]|jgi:uncharacterized phage-associated protein|nr:SocA family protein [Alphaproteobacteria bacterium]
MAREFITAIDVANTFITKFKNEKKLLKHKKLQKLVYYTYAMCLYEKNVPLFGNRDNFLALPNGPVCKEIYDSIQNNKKTNDIKECLSQEECEDLDTDLQEDINYYVEEIYNLIGDWKADKLVHLSHSIYGAWQKLKEYDNVLFYLKDEDIKEEFKNLFVE